MKMTNWRIIDGVDGNTYTYTNFFFHMFENSDLATEQNEHNFKRHLLLEVLGMLNVIHYVKDYDGCWEITIKVRND